MLASELPFEILSLVRDFLLTCERFQCIFVCKRWKVPFQESFWKNTEVDTFVNLRIETSKLNVPTPILIKLLTNYPSLKKINVSTHSSTKLLNFNLRNFNTLHKRSLQLEYIKGCFSLTDIHQNLIKTIPSTTPALHVTTLDLDLLDWDHLWLYYFSYKYLNLPTLKWKTICAPRKRIVKKYNAEKMVLLNSLQSVFPHLEMSFSTTLKKISIIRDAYFKAKNIVRSEFPYCLRLTSIELTDCGISITLDNILDNCPALRQLKFSRGQLTTSPEAHKESNTEIYNINLSHSQIGGLISAKIGSLCIDMSYTSFKLLQLSHVKFYSSENAMDKDTAINLTLLSHLTGLDMTAETEDLNKALEHSVENLARYHLYCELEGLFDFTLERSRVKNMSQSSEADRSFDGQVSQNDWKEDLYRGYVELRCGHAAK
ncbi:hypothetical protein PHYBLDRAFT_65477 [Phycomyces blakesleeanus NRRL 1555(-)]|uniref:F-box domain-containing protein n=1 Tax=Phycomyces blakesleeanus (strain ATCC 8743b / DSM 1359 / FGSC 10004 / NBRC 33097 / NRRL 1555) TaxID=763407 RepID=A0A163DN30_PHYB8|nr:hypothetical protein PHYBLDRAFT_65477 [Phycomyces blakesleeanus NRRL 1555(-)]OAD72480.1 hypothetical protein PHYBLDRAFT_65477 [Phycomyces blakesleeanus NRRL 1555(-)]|eukprot:XP_018290520.1 hypothetical protein PHYBLDRAFT_65477 [Phycomyces blakesleeanus NRRL 1555(-)]